MNLRRTALFLWMVAFVVAGMSCSSSPEGPVELQVSAPPASLGLDPFYQKYLDADGIPILGSEEVPDEAFLVVHETILHMLSKRRDVHEVLVRNTAKFIIISEVEQMSDLPEYRLPSNQAIAAQGRRVEVFRGVGGTSGHPVTIWAEENILCYPYDLVHGYGGLIHEFAHTIHLVGINALDPTFGQRLTVLWQSAMERGLWGGTLASDDTGTLHYWTEGVMRWYNAVDPERAPRDFVNHVNTREELKAYDPGLYNLVAEYFPDDDWKPHCFR